MPQPRRRWNQLPVDGFDGTVAFKRCPTLNQKESAMDWNVIEGNWKQLKGRIKEQWGELTDDDLDKIAGKREKLEGKLLKRYGLTKDIVRRNVDDWIKKQ
jgi:uncharacterized protein YjbJ (UPF0337 family)